MNSGGFVAPGLSPGTLTIDGDYEQGEAGTLVMEAAGLEQGQFDVLHVTQSATLGGTLEVRFLDGYLPSRGDAFDFLQSDAGVSGQVARVRFPDLAPGFEADLQIADDGRLRLTAQNDAVAGEGTTQDVSPSATQPLTSACGVGVCGAGFAPMLAAVLLCLHIARRARYRAMR